MSLAASTSVASISGCQYQLPVSLAASTSVASFSGCQYQLPVSLAASTSVASVSAAGNFSCQCLCLSCWYLCISCQCLSCLYLNCRCLCLGCRYLLVPWLVSTFCAMVAEDITKPVADDSCETIVEDTHESSAKMSCIQTLSPQTTTDQVICNSKNVMNI